MPTLVRLFIVIIVLAFAKPAGAQSASTFLSGTTISGYIDTYYVYNRNHPATPCSVVNGIAVYNCLRAFDVSRDSFSLNLASLTLDKTPTTESRGGFHVDFAFGSGVELLAGQDGNIGGVTDHLLQAYVSYRVPWGGVQFDVGKFETPAGVERIAPTSNWNASRSLLFALGVPREEVGLRAVYAPARAVTLTGIVSNGWSDRTENSGAKVVGGSVAVRPAGAVSVSATYLGGQESSRDLDGWRDVLDATFTAQLTSTVQFAANGDLGKDRRTEQAWQGAAAYLRFQVRDWLAITPRIEGLHDHDGFLTGMPQDLQEGTATIEFRAPQGALLRVDYRVDVADRPYFLKNVSTTVRTQSTVVANCVVFFGSHQLVRQEREASALREKQ